MIQQLYDSNAEKVSKKTSSEEKNEGARKTKIFKNEIKFFFRVKFIYFVSRRPCWVDFEHFKILSQSLKDLKKQNRKIVENKILGRKAVNNTDS